jgi:hypothetical protein
MTLQLPLSTKNAATPAAKYTTANKNSIPGDDGRRPTWPNGAALSGLSNGPIRLGMIDRRARGTGAWACFFGVTRPLPRLLLATDKDDTP